MFVKILTSPSINWQAVPKNRLAQLDQLGLKQTIANFLRIHSDKDDIELSLHYSFIVQIPIEIIYLLSLEREKLEIIHSEPSEFIISASLFAWKELISRNVEPLIPLLNTIYLLLKSTGIFDSYEKLPYQGANFYLRKIK